MQQLFAVIRTRGPAWQDSRPWRARLTGYPCVVHELAREEGFVILGGPLDGTPDVLLVIRARTPDEVRSRLAEDPWASKDLLRITRVAPWTLRLGSLE